MSKIKIITDSTSDIPSHIAKKYNIDVIPLNIFFGDEKYKDGINITAKDVYKRIQEEKNPWPRTSQPSAREFLEFYNKAFDNGTETVISIHITSNMSGTMNSANLAKQMLPEKDLILIDSNTVTHPLGLVVLETAKLVKQGMEKEKIVNAINNTFIAKSEICGVVDSLEYLHRGGRIGRAQKILGSLLKMKPLLHMVDGQVDSFGKVKGHEEAFSNYVRMVPKIFSNLVTDTVWLGYAEDNHYTKELYESIKDLPNAPKHLEMYEIGPAVGVHLGIGSMTMAWIGQWDTNWYFGRY
ncbi:MAG: DegV family protein [Asgard group archaeon]|nr:DegV family protein [Asgard group archaeon]